MILGFQFINLNESLASNLTVIYVGAKNCPSCKAFEYQSEETLKELINERRYIYRRVIVASFANISDKNEYPQDLQWLIDAAQLKSGTPLFLVLDKKKIILKVWGEGPLKEQIFPILQKNI